MATENITTNMPPGFLKAGMEDAVTQAQNWATKPQTAIGAPQQAGVDPFTQQAQDLAQSQLGLGAFTRDPTTGAVTNIGAGGSGITGYAPYLTGTGTQAGAATLTGPGAGQGLGSIASYASPYTQAIKDTALTEFDRQRGVDKTQLGYDAVKAGAFGGGRHGLTESDFLSQSLKDRAGLVAGFDQDAFLNAQKARQTDQAGLMDLAKQIQLQGSADLATIGGMGGQGQLYGQAGLDTAGQAERMRTYEPQDRINWFSNLLATMGGGMPGQGTSTVTQQTPQTAGMGAATQGLGSFNIMRVLGDLWGGG